MKVARYQQLAYETEKLIADGILRPGDRLPSVRQTCRTYAISPVTVTQNTRAERIASRSSSSAWISRSGALG